MLVDKTKSQTFDYSYAFVQYKNISTIEQYNFGIILKDDKGNTFSHIPTLSQTINICINLENKSAISYTLNKLSENLDNLGSIKEGKISDALNVTMYRPFTTDLKPEDALNFLVHEYITLKKLRVLEKTVAKSRYDKRSVYTLIGEYAKSNNITNLVTHKHFPITLKPIDLSLVDTDKNPYSIATISSPHLEQFHDSFIGNIFTLQDASRNGDIKNMFLHAPVFKNIKSVNLAKHIGWAKEQARNYNLDIEFDHREEAVLERLTI